MVLYFFFILFFFCLLITLINDAQHQPRAKMCASCVLYMSSDYLVSDALTKNGLKSD